MAENKTKETKASVDKFIGSIREEVIRKDCYQLIELMKSVTKEEPKMWGPSIIGFGTYHYKYTSGREGDMCLTGFSPRKQNITIYLMGGFEKQKTQLKKLGKHKIGKACLYLKSLNEVDQKILKEMIVNSINYMKKAYPDK